jgi:CheY-like chemotaxis protein
MAHEEGLRGRKVLVIEDEYIVAQILTEMLEDAGAEVVGPVGWLEEALAFVKDKTKHIDCAILDLNLHGGKSYPIADALIERDVSFVFTTGYDGDLIQGAYQNVPRCQKPFRAQELFTLLAAA